MTNIDYLYKKEFYEEEFRKPHFCNKKLSFLILDNALILPYKKIRNKIGGGVVTKDNKYIENTALHTKNGSAYQVSDIVESNEKVIYLGMFVGIWGHCITDNLRRMWFLETKKYREKYSEYKLIYVPFPGFEFGENYKTFLDILGIDYKNFIPISEVTRFDKVLIPDESFFTIDGNTRFFTEEYRLMINRVKNYGKANQTKISFDKVYFTYARYAGYKQIGEYKLEGFFKKLGYEIIAPEQLTFLEQLNILINCKCFASTIGSCSHNIMFMQENSDVILIPRGNYLTGYQLAIDEVTNLNISYVDASLSILIDENCPWNGPFYYYISDELLSYFKQCDKKINWKKNLCDFKRYLKLGTVRNDLSNCSAINYYSQILMKCLEKRKNETFLYKIKKKTKIMEAYCLIVNKLINR